MIKIKNLDKYYNKNKSNEIHVIDNTTIEFSNNGLVILLGHSGCGKTTFLNVVGGLDKAKGSISYNDKTINNYSMNKMDSFRSEHIGYIFQNYNLLLEETVYDNLKIALNLCGIYDKDEIDDRITYCLKAVKMFNYRKRKALALSGGQQQRVAIARALVKNPNIIIADEPTGNLDSVNTIEVMNIIKKISEKCLVILVTHEEKIADFYADRIIKIEDGKVLSDKFSSSNGNLSIEDNQNIYLKDLKTKKIDSCVNLTIFYDNEDDIKMDIDVIFKDGKIYIETNNKNTKVINVNSDVKLIDDHYKDITQDDLADFEFDTSFFKNNKNKNFDIIKILRGIKDAFFNVINVKKRTKLMYFGFLVLGMIIAFTSLSVSSYKDLNDGYINHLTTDADLVFVKDENDVKKAVNIDSYLSNGSSTVGEPTIIIYYNEHMIDNMDYYNKVLVYELSEKKKLLYGEEPIGKEIVISKKRADLLIELYSGYGINDYDDLFDLDLNCSYDTYKISGIVDSKQDLIYVTYEFDHFVSFGTDMGEEYSLIFGRQPENENEIIMNLNYLYKWNVSEDGKLDIFGDGTSFDVVGYYLGVKTSLLFHDSFINDMSYQEFEYKILDYSNVTLLEGKMPGKGECVVTRNSSNLIGSILEGYEIVGYVASQNSICAAYFNSSDYFGTIENKYSECYDYYVDGYVFAVTDINSALDELKALNIDAYSLGGYANQYYQATIKVEKSMILITICVLLGATMIFTYFMMRAKLINRIYNVGVYRALGAKKMNVYGMFFWEAVLLTTFTSILGYALAYTLMIVFNNYTKGLNIEFVKIDYLVMFSGFFFIYLVNIIFGMLPIVLLLRKTPSEILSKYDI